jgi:hypothetical protein
LLINKLHIWPATQCFKSIDNVNGENTSDREPTI